MKFILKALHDNGIESNIVFDRSRGSLVLKINASPSPLLLSPSGDGRSYHLSFRGLKRQRVIFKKTASTKSDQERILKYFLHVVKDLSCNDGLGEKWVRLFRRYSIS